MNKKTSKEMTETLNKVAEYVEQIKLQLKKNAGDTFVATLIVVLFTTILHVTNGFGGVITGRPLYNITLLTIGISIAILNMSIRFLTGKKQYSPGECACTIHEDE